MKSKSSVTAIVIIIALIMTLLVSCVQLEPVLTADELLDLGEKY